MIRENQTLLNRLNVVSDAFISYFTLPIAYWLLMSGTTKRRTKSMELEAQ